MDEYGNNKTIVAKLSLEFMMNSKDSFMSTNAGFEILQCRYI